LTDVDLMFGKEINLFQKIGRWALLTEANLRRFPLGDQMVKNLRSLA